MNKIWAVFIALLKDPKKKTHSFDIFSCYDSECCVTAFTSACWLEEDCRITFRDAQMAIMAYLMR